MIIEFYHPSVTPKTLIVPIGPDEVAWGYALNTATFPTYGGEVIQILSAYIEDLKIAGTVMTYRQMKEIYDFFGSYMTNATQGEKGTGEYNQTPMIFRYPHRGWEFEIQPLRAPGFAYGLEVIAPTWEMEAHIVDATPNVQTLEELVKKQVLEGSQGNEFLNIVGAISPDGGEPEKDPFQSPGTMHGNTFKPLDQSETTAELDSFADWYNKLIPAYKSGDYKSITGESGAEPAFGKQTPPKEPEKQQTAKKTSSAKGK